MSYEVNLENECSAELFGANRPAFDFYLFKNLLDSKLFKQLQRDVSLVKTEAKNNDLYKFRQSKDLICQHDVNKLPQSIVGFNKLLLDKVKPRLEKLTNLKLSSQRFDITTSQYAHGDYLLCHNDDIKDTSKKHARALAFVYYLNSELFTREDGGALILYKPDDKGEPVEESHHISPIPNSLVVFKTSPISWHSVQEVLASRVRASINGWFHLEEPPSCDAAPPAQIEICPYVFVRPKPLDERIEKFFQECIDPSYLMEKTCYLVRRKFKKASEINLSNFLVPEKYKAICDELKAVTSQESNLQSVGTYNKRHYGRIKEDCMPQICRDLMAAFKSEPFFMLLSRLTGLDLEPPSLVDQNDKVPGDSSDEDPEDEEDEDNDSDESEDGDEEEENENQDDDKAGSEEEEPCQEDGSPDDEEKDGIAGGSESQKEAEKDKAGAASRKREHEDEPSGSGDGTEKKRKRTSDPLARLEFRHLDVGSYTLVHDYAYETSEKSALDAVLHFNHDFTVNFDDGGYIAYIDGSNDDDEPDPDDRELLTIEPKSNCLSLVYREEGTCRFLKYINKSHKSGYQDLSCVYYEKPEDLPRQMKECEEEH